jgi:nicotinamidase/pyrazinamidase
MRGLLVVDVQNDFCEGGALGVDGGTAVARAISLFLSQHSRDYAAVVGSRDWHDSENDNGGHFAPTDVAPNFIDTWPVHCVAETSGAEYHPDLSVSALTHHVKKGQGFPAYSLFEGSLDDGRPVLELFEETGISNLDVVGIATDYCVRATALDAVSGGFQVRVFTNLIAAVSDATGTVALKELGDLGVALETSE